jgi:hypothetical protein
VWRKTCPIFFFFHGFLGALAKERAQIGTDVANMGEEFVVLIRANLDGDPDRATYLSFAAFI